MSTVANTFASDEAHAASLASLPGMHPRRLVRLLNGLSPELAWRALGAGTHPEDAEREFMAAVRRTDPADVAARYEQLGVHVLLPERAGYPTPLVGDPGEPAVLFALGDPAVVEGRRRVAIVGTRAATHYGRAVASELGANLAAESVSVVSGLATGIDAAAHMGALRSTGADLGPPIAVAGTGLDVIYPTTNRQLWEQVARNGVVFSESPLGTKPYRGVFPARNRIIAALSDVVVIVESHHHGGALFTADAAARRSIPVCAVPGSVHSRASEGTNLLLVDGCIPVRDADDVLVALSLARAGPDLVRMRAQSRTETEVGSPSRVDGAPETGSAKTDPSSDDPTAGKASPNAGDGRPIAGDGHPRAGAGRPSTGCGGGPGGPPGSPQTGRGGRRARDRPMLTASQQLVLEAVDDIPTAFETILIRTDLSIATAAEVCDQLVEQGLLRAGAGWWSTA